MTETAEGIPSAWIEGATDALYGCDLACLTWRQVAALALRGSGAASAQTALAAAQRVADNAYGTKPRHTRGRDGGCRDDCIPCGLDSLRDALSALGLPVLRDAQ